MGERVYPDWNAAAPLRAEAHKVRITPVIGCRLQLVTGETFFAYPLDRAAYGRLCTLLCKGKMQATDGSWQAKGACDITLDDLAQHSADVQLSVLPGLNLDHFSAGLRRLKRALPTLKYIAANSLYRSDDRARINYLSDLAKARGLDGDHGASDKRAVTLVQAEHLPVIGAMLGRAAIPAADLRRNLVVAGLNLAALKGRQIRIGTAVLELTGICAPCSRMEQALGHDGYSAVRGHGGWCARVITPGDIACGDPVTPR